MDYIKLSSFFVSEASYHTVEPMSYTDSDDDDVDVKAQEELALAMLGN